MKKILQLIVSAIAMVSIASAVTVTTDVAYKTKSFNKGLVSFEDVVVAGTEIEAAGFVLGVNTFNTIEANSAGGKVASSGLLKQVDTTAGYKFTAPLANLTLGAKYSAYTKSAKFNGKEHSTELVARLDGRVKNTLLTWDATASFDNKNKTNNLEANVRAPFGFKWVKIAPAVGVGFNDPGAATLAALKSAKRYATLGVGIGYYSVNTVVAVEVYQSRQSFTTSGVNANGVSLGIRHKL